MVGRQRERENVLALRSKSCAQASLQEITALQTFEALQLPVSLSWMRGIVPCFYCLIVKSFRRFKSLIFREQESVSSLSQYPPTPLPHSSSPSSLFSILYHVPLAQKICQRKTMAPMMIPRQKKGVCAEAFLSPFSFCALHLT